MKKQIAFLLLVLIVCALSACGGGSAGGKASNLQGSPADVLAKIIEDAAKSLPADRPMPMCFDAEVNGDTSQNALGLSSADFDKYVSSATVSTAAIATFAHQVCLIQAKDASSAAEVKKRIAGDGGFDSRKWICVFPEESSVIESGSYVLLAASRADVVEAVVAAFTEAAGTVGERETFFTSDSAGEGGMALGGGMGLVLQ